MIDAKPWRRFPDMIQDHNNNNNNGFWPIPDTLTFGNTWQHLEGQLTPPNPNSDVFRCHLTELNLCKPDSFKNAFDIKGCSLVEIFWAC